MDKRRAIITVFILLFSSLVFADEEIKDVAQDVSFNKEGKTISYSLNFPAYIRIRLGVEEGPLYRTLLNWDKREPGKHQEQYTGLDNKKTVFTFNYFTMDDADRYGLELGEILPSPAQLAIGKTLPTAILNQMHKRHRREFCYDPKINIYLRGVQKKEGVPIVRKTSPLVVEIDKKDKEWFTRERFQVHIFLDDVLVHSDLEGYVPYVWNFYPDGLNPGKHAIIVNLSGFSDHIGTATLPIFIEKDKA